MSAYDCRACGACCREAFDAVEIDDDDPFVTAHPELVVRTPFGRVGVARADRWCAALEREGGCFSCRVYPVRPQTCRDVEPGGEACRWARARIGLAP